MAKLVLNRFYSSDFDAFRRNRTALRARRAVHARACGGVFSPLCPVWDLLLRDMPPPAWLLIAPGPKESRPSGTDVADGDREHGAERPPFKHHLMTADLFSPGRFVHRHTG